MLLLFINLVVATQLTFDRPGKHQLTPEMYNFADEITVEMWGAGGGGCSGTCGIGGGSGAYIKAKIETLQQTFDLSVGLGGQGGMGMKVNYKGDYKSDYDPMLAQGVNGGDSSVIGTNTKLIAGGGYQGNHSCTQLTGYHNEQGIGIKCVNQGLVKSDLAHTIITKNGDNGLIGSVYTLRRNYKPSCINDYIPIGLNLLMSGGNGGQSGIGYNGKGNNYYLRTQPPTYNSVHANPGTDGSNPGNGGGGAFTNFIGCNEKYVVSTLLQRAGNGGNGTIIVTFESRVNNTCEITQCSDIVDSVHEIIDYIYNFIRICGYYFDRLMHHYR